MVKLRHILLTAVAVLAPTATVHATGTADPVTSLANDAAELVAQEQELLYATSPDQTRTAAESAEARARLRSVDSQASSLLAQFDQLEIELSPAARTALERLPRLGGLSTRDVLQIVPIEAVYDAAVDDLARIATTPAAAGDSGSSYSAASLLMVAFAALAVLGLAAYVNTRKDEDELTAMAWSDSLTGLANRRRLDHDLSIQRDDVAPAAVIMIDVDHFKAVNDKFGHLNGDDILRRIGTVLSDHVRRDDVVYRYGGEEFCVLLPGASVQDAQVVAERIVAAAHGVKLPDGDHITVSVGVADGNTAEMVNTLETADRALYSAKASGRDQAVVAEQADDLATV